MKHPAVKQIKHKSGRTEFITAERYNEILEAGLDVEVVSRQASIVEKEE